MKNRGKVLAIGLVALLLGTVLVLEFFSRQIVTIRMTDEGYEPSKITIQLGQKVIWKNVGTMERWPASNSHPTHEDYPSENKSCLGSELDACRAMRTGETYKFVFTAQGSWGMHDHLSPSEGMVVNVSDTGRGWLGKLRLLLREILKRPAATENMSAEAFRELNYGEQQTALESLARKDPAAAWRLLKEAYIVNSQITRDVHEFAHIVGHAAYEKQGLAGVGICDESFAYGCFHGVAEEAITRQGEGAVTQIEQACTDTLDEAKRPSCYHGIGHGTATIHKLRLQPALAACDKLQPDNRTYCYDGVFMEHATALESAGITREEPWKLCESIDERFYVACARYQPARLEQVGFDFTAGLQTCARTDKLQLKEHCSRAYGYTAIRQAGFMPAKINSLCATASDSESADWCRIAAAHEARFQNYTGWRNIVADLCEQVSHGFANDECRGSLLKEAIDPEARR